MVNRGDELLTHKGATSSCCNQGPRFLMPEIKCINMIFFCYKQKILIRKPEMLWKGDTVMIALLARCFGINSYIRQKSRAVHEGFVMVFRLSTSSGWDHEKGISITNAGLSILQKVLKLLKSYLINKWTLYADREVDNVSYRIYPGQKPRVSCFVQYRCRVE